MNYTTQSEQPDVTAVQNTTASAVTEDVAPTAYTDTAVTADSEVTPTTTVQATADEDTVSPEQSMPMADTTETVQTEPVTPAAQATPDEGTPLSGQTMPETDTTETVQTEAASPVAQAISDEGTPPPELPMPMTDNMNTGQTAASTPTAQTATAQNAAALVPILSQPASSNPFASLSGKPLPHLKGTDKATALFNYMAPNCKLYCNDQKQCYLKYDNKISGIAMLYSDEMYEILDSERRDLTERQKKLIAVLETGTVSQLTSVTDRLTEIDNRLQEINTLIGQNAPQSVTKYTTADIPLLKYRFRQAYCNDKQMPEKSAFIRNTIECITVGNENISVKFKGGMAINPTVKKKLLS